MTWAVMLPKVRGIFYQHRCMVKQIVILILLLMCMYYLVHPLRFASKYDYIKKSEIINELDPSPLALNISAERKEPLCPLLMNDTDDKLLYPDDALSEFDATSSMARNLGVKQGGAWHPMHCVSQHQVVIVIPYRNRSSQLNTFLAYMHPFLQKQLLDYRIVVVEQSSREAFNRAKLFNIGYKEALKIFPYHCFIFHDVDLIPQKLSNIYTCTHQPRHMSSSLNTFRYNLPYRGLFGGVVAIQRKQFELVNGFSNIFYGWGGEDDDFQDRVLRKDMHVSRFAPEVARYIMLAHSKALPNENRFANLQSGRERAETDGINNLYYTVLKLVYQPLCTWILVDI